MIHFARDYALAAYRSQTLEDLRQAHEGLKAILDLHVAIAPCVTGYAESADWINARMQGASGDSHHAARPDIVQRVPS